MYSPKKRAWSLLIKCKQHNAFQSSLTQITYLKTGVTPFTQTAAVQRIKNWEAENSSSSSENFRKSEDFEPPSCPGTKAEEGNPMRLLCPYRPCSFKDSSRYNPRLSRKCSAFRERRRTWSCARKTSQSLSKIEFKAKLSLLRTANLQPRVCVFS